jgi:hypothetical protein
MADKKISQLTAAATPLAGTEVLPIVQSGATVKVSVANLTAGRSVAATNLSAGLGAVGTPAYTFTGDDNTGMWSPGADTLAFSTAGAERVSVTSAGSVGLGTNVPGQTLQVVNASSFQFRLGAGATFNYDMGRSSADGLLYFYGNQSGFTGFVFSGADGERMRVASAGNVGVGTAAPDAAAQLDVASTTRGFLPPRMTTAQRDLISSPPDGLVLYNTSTNKLQVRAAGAWVDLH